MSQISVNETSQCTHGFPMTSLECSYSPSHWVPGNKHPNEVIANFVKIMLAFSLDLRQNPMKSQLDVVYDPTKKCKCKSVDIYGVGSLPECSPIFIFIHGGYWTEGSKDVSKSMVRSLVSRGVTVAIVGYKLAPKVCMKEIVQQILQAVQYLHKWAEKRNSTGLYLAGHSAGAHLVTSALLENTEKLPLLKSIILIAGVYNLSPFLNFTMNDLIRLTADSAEKFSPINHVEKLVSNYPGLKFKIVTAQNDCPGITGQNQKFFEKLSQLCAVKKIPNSENSSMPEISIDNFQGDHFSLISNLHDQNSELFKLLVDTINLS